MMCVSHEVLYTENYVVRAYVSVAPRSFPPPVFDRLSTQIYTTGEMPGRSDHVHGG